MSSIKAGHKTFAELLRPIIAGCHSTSVVLLIYKTEGFIAVCITLLSENGDIGTGVELRLEILPFRKEHYGSKLPSLYSGKNRAILSEIELEAGGQGKEFVEEFDQNNGDETDNAIRDCNMA